MTGARDKWTHQQTRWLTDDAAEDMAAHEISHQLGILDEYHDPFGSPNRAVIDDESLMGDFANYDSPSVKQRHIDQIGGDIDQARQSEVAAARKTQPMEAVQPSASGPAIDETKAAAETQKMPVQSDAVPATPTGDAPRMEAQLTTAGRERPVPLTNSELGAVQEVSSLRNQVLKMSREADLSALPQPLQDSMRRAENALRDHLTPDDMAAALKEARGEYIPRPGGGVYDHAAEVAAARTSIVNMLERLKARLTEIDRGIVASAAEREHVQGWLSQYSILLDLIESKHIL